MQMIVGGQSILQKQMNKGHFQKLICAEELFMSLYYYSNYCNVPKTVNINTLSGNTLSLVLAVLYCLRLVSIVYLSECHMMYTVVFIGRFPGTLQEILVLI